jgi:seryl-tRNA synthetase
LTFLVLQASLEPRWRAIRPGPRVALMHFRLPLVNAIPEELVVELERGAAYASSHLRRLQLSADRREAVIECADGTQAEVIDKVRRHVEVLVATFRSPGAPEELARGVRRDDGPIVSDAFAELERRRWVRALGRGQVALTGGAFALRRFLDEAVRDFARARFGAEEQDHPALIDTEVLARCGYFSSFPHSVCLVSHLAEDFDAIEAFRAANADGESLRVPDPGAMRHSDAALRPAVCLPVYRALEGETLPEGGVTVTTSGKAFRYESSNLQGMHRLWDFSMREIVFAGSAEVVHGRRPRVVEAVVSLMNEWDLGFRLESASDPFFATVRGTKALWQRTRDLKYEMLVDVGATAGTVAVGSLNFAGTLFGHAFGIRTREGEAATTACVGFGLERLVLALFSQHGFDPGRWPGAMREVVFG